MAEEDENLESLDDEDEEEGKEPEKKKLPEKWVKIATYSLVSIIIFLLSALISHFVIDIMDDIEESKNEDVVEEVTKKEDFSVFPLPSYRLVLDRGEDETKQSIVQVELALAYKSEDEDFILELNDRKQQIRSIVQFVTAQKTYKEISSVDKRYHTLKKDIKRSINDVLKKGRILDIFFNTFVITQIPG